ncbi:hypothetical protein BH09VER1_BH09VER1_56280 [soil metagenome]
MKILIVEDEAMVALSLKLLLQMHGHEIIGMSDDVASSIAAADANLPDLAFVDIQLARGASGLDVAAELRKRGIICIFLTGNPPRPRPDLALGCIPKPYTDEALAGAVAAAKAVIDGEAAPIAPLGLELYSET